MGLLLEVLIDFNGRVISVKSIPYKNREELYFYLESRIEIGKWTKVYGTIFKDDDGRQVRTYELYENESVFLAFMQEKESLVPNMKLSVCTKLSLALESGRSVSYRVLTEEDLKEMRSFGKKSFFG